MDKAFSFNLNLVDKWIVKTLKEAIEISMPEIMADNDLDYKNGYGQFRWNVIIKHLNAMCRCIGWVECGVCDRASWKLPVLYHDASKYIITLMTESRFKDIQRQKGKARHYLCGAASFNNNIQAKYEQLCLDIPKIGSDNGDYIIRSRKDLVKAVGKDESFILGHILVLFDVFNDKLLKVRAVRVTKDLEISTEEEDWSRFISDDVAENKVVEPQYVESNDEEDTLVELL